MGNTHLHSRLPIWTPNWRNFLTRLIPTTFRFICYICVLSFQRNHNLEGSEFNAYSLHFWTQHNALQHKIFEMYFVVLELDPNCHNHPFWPVLVPEFFYGGLLSQDRLPSHTRSEIWDAILTKKILSELNERIPSGIGLSVTSRVQFKHNQITLKKFRAAKHYAKNCKVTVTSNEGQSGSWAKPLTDSLTNKSFLYLLCN